MQINMHEAKTQLSKLVEAVEKGGDVVIARRGKPVARLVAFAPAVAARRPGSLMGQITLAPDFDDTPADIIDLFEGGGGA